MDVWVSMWRMASMEGSGVSWSAVRDRIEAMKARGVLFPPDEPFLEEARKAGSGGCIAAVVTDR